MPANNKEFIDLHELLEVSVIIQLSDINANVCIVIFDIWSNQQTWNIQEIDDEKT